MPPTNPRNKQWILPIVSFLLVAGILIYSFFSSPDKPAEPEKNNEPTAAIDWPSEQVRKETISESNKTFEITAYYPVTKSESITNNYFRTFVTETIAAFKADITAAGELPEGYRAMALDISYEERKSERADNYVFTVYTDTGGAHGLSTTHTFSFTKSGELIKLENLFTNGTRGLGVIADYVKTELMKREFSDKDWVAEGAAATEDNYRSFVVGDSGVTFIFDPYQVAAYAAGIQTVSVPTTVFKTIANREIFTHNN